MNYKIDTHPTGLFALIHVYKSIELHDVHMMMLEAVLYCQTHRLKGRCYIADEVENLDELLADYSSNYNLSSIAIDKDSFIAAVINPSSQMKDAFDTYFRAHTLNVDIFFDYEIAEQWLIGKLLGVV